MSKFLLTLVCAIVLFTIPVVLGGSFKKMISTSKLHEWVPLGKFSSPESAKMRARIVSELKPKGRDTVVLYIVTYVPSKWLQALNATNCSGRIQHQTDQHDFYVPLNTAWSNWQNVLFPESYLYIVASDCDGVYSARLANQLTEIEIAETNYSKIPDSELSRLVRIVPSGFGTNKESEKESRSKRVGISYFGLTGFGILLLSVVTLLLLLRLLAIKEFFFTYTLLLATVLTRVIVHLLLLSEAFMPSGPVFQIAAILDKLAQFGFTLHCVLISLGLSPTSEPNQGSWGAERLINGSIVGAVYLFIGIGMSAYTAIVLRSMLILHMIVCFVAGVKRLPRRPSTIHVVTFVAGLLYLLGLLVIGFAEFACSEAAQPFLNKIERLVAYFVCPIVGYWAFATDLLFQGFIIGTTLALSAAFAQTRRNQA